LEVDTNDGILDFFVFVFASFESQGAQHRRECVMYQNDRLFQY
jgi:hypothetical protein